MKAYQVFKGDVDKYNHQYYDLVATYLDKDQAFNHAEQIARDTPLYGDILEFDGGYTDNKVCNWSAVGWELVCIARMDEIEINTNNSITPVPLVNRVEVIDANGRCYINKTPNCKVQLSFQDDGRTLKVFINK